MNDNVNSSPSPVPPEPIAIVGIGCRLPGGASSPERLWALLCNGVDAVGDIPAERWDPDRFYAPIAQTPGRMSSRRAGCLDDVTSFDGEFFGIVPRVAEQMDPQQRILLEVTWEGLEDAGIPPTGLAGTRTGVYIGVCSHDYGDIQSAPCELEGLDAHSATGNFMSIVANRLSYTLDLRGPSMVVDTACSSSLVAVHLACNALRQRECDLAVAGGVNVMLSPHFPISLSQANMLSPDGRSRAFDASANGYVRGEGAGVVVLKRHSEALRDNDRIYALIRGSAVNQDGRTPGITVPGGGAQEANALAALAQAGIAPSQVGYLEAHGTGTPVGDPIEANALGRVINADGKRGPAQRAFMGSIKTNIGHLEAGAGIAGLIKATLVVGHRAIPPSLHFEDPNPQIDFQARRLAVPTKIEAWPAGHDRAIAGVNSFGFGGTNAHVVLEEPPPVPVTRPAASAAPRLLSFSARSEEALHRLAEGWADWLERQGDAESVDAVAHFLALRRSHHDYRLAVVAATPAEAAASLRQHLRDGQAPGVTTGRKRSGARRKLAFLFNGQGPQWWAMGRKLLETEPVFADVVRACDRLARPFIDWSILDELTATETLSHINATYALQPTMFALQMGLVALWRSWGVEPEGVVGHSLGDITAACVAGIIDLATALQIICNRSRIQDQANPEGGMLYAMLSPAEAEEKRAGDHRRGEPGPGRLRRPASLRRRAAERRQAPVVRRRRAFLRRGAAGPGDGVGGLRAAPAAPRPVRARRARRRLAADHADVSPAGALAAGDPLRSRECAIRPHLGDRPDRGVHSIFDGPRPVSRHPIKTRIRASKAERMSGPHGRQGEMKDRSHAELGLDPDAPAVRRDELIADRQTKAGPQVPGFLGLPVSFEEMRQRLLGDAGASIADRELHPILDQLRSNRDLSAPLGEFHGVAEQVREHLRDPFGVGPERRQVGR